MVEKFIHSLDKFPVIKESFRERQRGSEFKKSIKTEAERLQKNLDFVFGRLQEKIPELFTNEVIVFPRLIENKLVFQLPHFDREIFRQVLVDGLEGEKINVNPEERFITRYYEKFLSDFSTLARVSPRLREILLKDQTTEKIPRYAVNVVAAKKEEAGKSRDLIYLYYQDIISGTVFYDKTPVNVSHEDKDSASSLSVRLADQISLFQQWIKSENKTQLNSPYEKIQIEREEIDQEPASDYYLEELDEAFAPEDIKSLKLLGEQGRVIECEFFYPSGGSITQSLELDPQKLATIGRIKFRYLDKLNVVDIRGEKAEQFSFYPDVLAAYEQSHQFKTDVMLAGESEVPIKLGQMEVDKFEYKNLKPYHYYDFGRGTLNKEEIEDVIKGVKEAEALFGQGSGELVRRIIIDKRAPFSGGTYRSKADTLAVFSDWSFLTFANPDLGSIACHETFHLVDDRFNITEKWQKASAGSSTWSPGLRSLYNFYQASPSELVSKLAEEVIDNRNPKANIGHPEDGTSEFFASLMNSLYIRESDKALRNMMDIDFLEWYQQALLHTMERLSEIKELDQAPVLERLAQRTVEVEEILRSYQHTF